MEKLFGHNSIHNNCFESLFNPIYISWSGELVFDGNYFEDGGIQGLGTVASFEGLESTLVISNNNRQTDNTRHMKVLGKIYDYREYNNSTFTVVFLKSTGFLRNR